jgi:hypothetical protein
VTTTNLLSLSVVQLRRAASIKEQIETLEAELSNLLGGISSGPAGKGNRSTRSAATRAKMAAAQRARWAKVNAGKQTAPVKQGRRKMSAVAKARLSALTKARWAKLKATGKKKLA